MTVPGGLMALFAGGAKDFHTFDAVSTYSGNALQNQFTHTCAADATVLVVCVTVETSDLGGVGVNYNGVAMTEVASSPKDVAETVARLFYLIDPPTGSAYTVDVDNPSIPKTFAASASSYISSTGKTEFDTDTGSTGNPDTDPTSDSITTGKNGCVVVQASGTGDDFQMAGNKTSLFSHDFGNSRAGHQYELKETAGSTTFEWNTFFAEDGTHVLASFKPA